MEIEIEGDEIKEKTLSITMSMMMKEMEDLSMIEEGNEVCGR